MWKLTVGSDDLTPYVKFLNLSETASSSQDSGSITVNGTHSSIVPGAAVTLTDANGVVAWEGTVSSTIPYANATGINVVTLASQCAVAYSYGSYSGNDIAVLAQGLLSATNIPWGSYPNLGIEVGGLTFHSVDDGLTVLAYLGGYTWRVQNGQCVFINGATGSKRPNEGWGVGRFDIARFGLNPAVTQLPGVSLATTPNSVSSITVLGGADIITRIPLSITVSSAGSAGGPAVQVSYPEISDSGTIGILANSLSEVYGSGSTSATATVTQTLRAGDWVQDANGIVTIAWRIQWGITNGLLQAVVNFGYPALSTQPQYSPAFSDAMHRFPVSRLTSDYVVNGCSASISGSTVLMSTGIVSIGNTLSSALSSATITPPDGVSYIIAKSGNYAESDSAVLPGQGVNLYRVSVSNGVIVGLQDIRQFGGVGKLHMIPVSVDSSNGVWDLTNNLYDHTHAMSKQTQDVVLNNSGSGQLNVAPAGNVTGNLTGGNLQGGTIQTAHISNQAVTGPLVQATVYSTNQTNSAGTGSSASDWYSNAVANYITNSTTLANGDTIKWNTGSGSYLGSSNPYMESLTISGSSSITAIFQHSAFLSGAGGRPRVFFQGQSSGSTSNQQQSTPFSGSSTCTVSATAKWSSGIGYYNFRYSQSNGATYTVNVSPNTAVGAGTPLALNLTSVNCPSANDGSSSLTITLTNQSGITLQTWTGITTPQTLTYSTSQTAQTFSWNITAVPSNNDGTSNPYNENMQDTLSGTATYYNSVGSTGQTYVKAPDGSVRMTTSDSNILFTLLSCDTIAFQIFNSSSSATGFSLGVDVGGL